MPIKYRNIWYIIATHCCETTQNEENWKLTNENALKVKLLNGR